MKISILLPYKEDYTQKYSGAVSIHVSNLFKHSYYKRYSYVYGNTKRKQFLSKNFINIKINSNILSSNNRKYLAKFINLNINNIPDIIEIHNRPSYVETIKKRLNSRIILYFHNNPLTISGSKNRNDRLKILNDCEHIFFNSVWTKNQFFKDINQTNYLNKFSICYQSTKRQKVDISKKKKIITFVGKLNTAKGYDIFGQSVIQILNKYKDWKCIVVGDEPREKHFFKHKNLKVYNFKENNFVLDLLKKASISVACSRWEEPFGRTSLEACSMGCATIITDRGGLIETTKHPIILKNLDSSSLFKKIEKLIINKKYRIHVQKLNYNSFFLSHQYVSKIIDNIRKKIFFNNFTKFNINKKSKLKIIHVTNFNYRYHGRLQYNTGIRINNGFIRQGHNVLSLSDRDLISFSKSIRDPSGGNYLNNLISKTVDNFKPNLLVLGHADKVSPDNLQNLKNKHKNMRVTQWFLDPLSKKGPDYVKNKDRILNKNKACDSSFITTDPKALDFKINNVFYMPNPCDKSIDHLENFNDTQIYDIFYAISHGVHSGILRPGKLDEREIFIKKLMKKCKDIKFDTYGMFGRQPVWGNDFLNQISNSKMSLNLSRGQPVKYYSSDRIAQLMGNGLLTFIDKRTQFSDFFNDKEMVFYKDVDELSEKIKKYSRDDKERKIIAKNGHAKYHKFFNSDVVAQFIINRTFGLNSKNYWE